MDWTTLVAGTYTAGSARYINADAVNTPELIFVFTRDTGYEYVRMRTPFGAFPDNYYYANTTKGELKFYWQKSTGTIDIVFETDPVFA